jgi:abortive infection bacteriophage resistance protein
MHRQGIFQGKIDFLPASLNQLLCIRLNRFFFLALLLFYLHHSSHEIGGIKDAMIETLTTICPSQSLDVCSHLVNPRGGSG